MATLLAHSRWADANGWQAGHILSTLSCRPCQEPKRSRLLTAAPHSDRRMAGAVVQATPRPARQSCTGITAELDTLEYDVLPVNHDQVHPSRERSITKKGSRWFVLAGSVVLPRGPVMATRSRSACAWVSRSRPSARSSATASPSSPVLSGLYDPPITLYSILLSFRWDRARGIQPVLASSGTNRAASMVPTPVTRSYPGLAGSP